VTKHGVIDTKQLPLGNFNLLVYQFKIQYLTRFAACSVPDCAPQMPKSWAASGSTCLSIDKRSRLFDGLAIDGIIRLSESVHGILDHKSFSATADDMNYFS